MAVNVTIKTTRLADLENKLKQIEAKLNDFSLELEKTKENFADYTEKVFATEGASGDGPWQDLSEQRVRNRGKIDPARASNPILTWEGHLRQVATFKKTTGTRVSGYTNISPHQAEFYIEGDKVYNQFGGKRQIAVNDSRHQGIYGVQRTGRSSIHLPARPFWADNKNVYDLMFKSFEDWAKSI